MQTFDAHPVSLSDVQIFAQDVFAQPPTRAQAPTINRGAARPDGRTDRRASRFVGASACLRPEVVGVAYESPELSYNDTSDRNNSQ